MVYRVIPNFRTVIVSYPADIVLALCGDGLIDHFLAANAEENFFNLVQKFLQRQKKKHLKICYNLFHY